MSEDIAQNIELMPLIKGTIVSVVLILIGMLTSLAFLNVSSAIIGSAIAGYLTNNSTIYALIYGAIIGIVTSFFMLTVFSVPLFIIFGLFGGFIGKVLQSNLQ